MIEPGFVIAGLLVVVPAVQLVGALLARQHFRALNRIYDELDQNPSLTDDDRESLASGMREAVRGWPVWILAALAPLWSVPFFIAAIIEVVRNWNVTAEMQEEQLKEEMKRYREVLDETKLPEHSSAYSGVYVEFLDHVFYASAISAPFATLWIGLWALPGLAAFALGGAADKASRRFRMIFEASVRWISEPRFV